MGNSVSLNLCFLYIRPFSILQHQSAFTIMNEESTSGQADERTKWQEQQMNITDAANTFFENCSQPNYSKRLRYIYAKACFEEEKEWDITIGSDGSCFVRGNFRSIVGGVAKYLPALQHRSV